jgi:hypothetical protein
MLRFFLGCLLVGLIAIVIGWRWYGQELALQDTQAKQVTELAAQVTRLTSDNARLNAQLNQVQSEEARLTRDNDALRETIQETKLTGKLPPKDEITNPPYPPK